MKNNSKYRGQDILNDSYRNIMLNYFNPYEYNLDSNLKDMENYEISKMKTKSHELRKKTKK